ncbi:FTR1 family iron permease [Vibrio furnissii]|uniref:FTR1 family iron permease n=1 Tax=Vibrio furnissii TaxID=29494 RepID=UPI003751D078
MLSSAIIVFREVLEAALIVTILMAATKGLPGRTRWIFGGVTAGLFGALIVAFSAGAIASTFEGMGQELFNAGILLTAVLMLAWHNIWMSKHARELVAHLKQVSSQINDGSLPLYFLSVATGLAVLREGSEVVLFLYGIAAGGDSGLSMLTGGALGVIAGVIAGSLLYFGLLRIPTRWLFRVTGWMILFLAAGLAASAAGYLMQAGDPHRAGATMEFKCDFVGAFNAGPIAAYLSRLSSPPNRNSIGVLCGDDSRHCSRHALGKPLRSNPKQSITLHDLSHVYGS